MAFSFEVLRSSCIFLIIKKIPTVVEIIRYTLPRLPRNDGRREEMNRNIVFNRIKKAAFLSPIITGSIGILAFL